MSYKKPAVAITLVSIIILIATLIFAGSNLLQKKQATAPGNNTQRIKEPRLDMESDFLDEYYFNNPDKSTTTWKLDENTEYIFIDWGQDFIKDKNVIDTYSINVLIIYTKYKELFHKYLDTYTNSKPGMPFFFEVKNGVVKRIAEKFFA